MQRRRPILIYDGSCGMCRRTVRMVRAFDWLHRIECMAFDDAATRFSEVAASALDEGVRMRFADGSLHLGIDAVRSVMVRTPLGLLVGGLLYLPGVHGCGDRAYRWVAARRTTSACRVPGPTRS